MSTIEERVAALEVDVAALKAAKAAAPSGEVSTEKPRYDFEIKIGRDKGKKPSELSSKQLDSLAAFMDKCAANPQPGKEQYVDSNKKAAANYRRWAAYKRAVEQGLVTEQPALAYEPDSYGSTGTDDDMPF
jgi:hypothetical protein